MDAFFASVEQRDHPELRGKAVAVGGSSERGVVAAASYEARKFGVRSAMPSKIAARKCPHLIFVKARFQAYKEVSRQIREIFKEYTDLVEPLSLDEAYLDVSQNKKNMDSAKSIALEIKQLIKERTQLTASAGISYNKFLAKIASDINKPDGICLIHPSKALAFIEKLPIEKFFGIGKVTASKMHQLGIFTGVDLKKYTEAELGSLFGKHGKYYFQIVRGIDNRPVNPFRIRKSVGVENTFNEDLISIPTVKSALEDLSKKLWERMNRSHSKGKTLNLKIKFHDFQQITRSRTMTSWIEDEEQMQKIYEELLSGIDSKEMKVRLLGLSFSNLNHQMELVNNRQLELDFK